MADSRPQAPEAIDYSDKALVQLMVRLQGKTKRQAECAVRFLTMLGYSPIERFQILSVKNSKVNFICYFGSLWPMVIIALILIIILAGVLYNSFGANNAQMTQIFGKETSKRFFK